MQTIVRGLFCLSITIIVVISMLSWRTSAQAAGIPIIMACPAVHPFKESVPLVRGDVYGVRELTFPRPNEHWTHWVPFGVGGPPGYYATNGWAYLLIDVVDVIEDVLKCTYADESVVDYPLPHPTLRGRGSCHFVMEWEYKDARWNLIKGWPYGIERKPMAVCVFDPDAVTNPNFKPPTMDDDD